MNAVCGLAVRIASVGAATTLAACTFSPTLVEPDAVAGDPGVDAADLDVDASPPDAGPVPCGAADPSSLVLCLELEDGVDDGLLVDSSANQHHALTSGLLPMTRTVPWPSQAARVGPTADTRVPEHPALDLAAGYTVAVWVNPASLPAPGTAVGVIDREQQYALVIGSAAADGSLQNRCVHTGVARFELTRALPVGAWSFLACTWDGVELCAYRWASPTDHERACHVAALPPNPGGTQGLAIGSLSAGGAAHGRFDGALDSVQLYRRALDERQLCAAIGQPAGCMPCDSGSCL